MNNYFSDRENGPLARTKQVITPTVWSGIVGTVQSLISSGAFGLRFPERCPDGQVTCGCDTNVLAATVRVDIPGLTWPLETTQVVESDWTVESRAFAPNTLLILDFLEFVHDSVAKSIPGKYHDYYNHHHLTFDQQTGQEEFRKTINSFFARNGVAYEMRSSGRIERMLPVILGEELKQTVFRTGDTTLDNMLEECRRKFVDRDPLVHREALERLWDAWERLKSLADPNNKKNSIKIILDAITSEPSLRDRLDKEANELTSIGNSHLLRHTEINQIPVIDVDHVDYLFHRLFSMIHLMLKKKERL